MEDDMILKQPADRRLAGDTNDLPPGPPGAENDDDYSDTKREEKSVAKETSKSRRRSPSGSPPPSKRKSPSRGPRSPRGRRTPSPRRRYGRNRDYSPDRRRFNDRGRMRRSPIRNRSRDRMDHRRNGRDRFRGRRDSRSRTRSNSPPARRRWSPKKKPTSPPIPPPGAQYGVPGPGMYADAYTAYGQYGPPQQGYVPADFVGAPPPAAFGTAYPPPPTWGVPPEGYPQPNWVPQPEPLPPAVMQPQPGVVAQPPPAAVQPPGTQPPPPTIGADKKTDVNPTHDAVAQEAENQRDELKKQRTNYLKKTAALKKELKVLKEQRKDLIGGEGSHSPTTKGFLDENERLQSQIQKKLSTIENVIDMLTGIIGEENLVKDDALESPKKHSKKKRGTSSSSSSDDSSSSTSSSTSSSSSSSDSEDNSSPERLKTKAIESMKHKRDVQGKAVVKEKKIKEEVKKTEEKKINYVFYDPEMHWCKTCDAFPKTAKDFLTHLHSKEHSDHVDTMETPWHTTMTSDEYPSFDAAPTKRTPIRGLTFFVPATAWYCKLCSVWMGDLHCASLHLKSRTHSNKYNTFLEKNPHFEVDWLADRQRVLNEKKSAPPPPQITSVSTTGGSDHKEGKSKSKHEDKEKSKKRKKKGSDKKDKKKKKRSKKRKKAAALSQSSSSSQDSSSETEAKAKKKLIEAIPVAAIGAVVPPVAPSIRVQMRNLKKDKELDMEMQGPAPPPPPKISEQPPTHAVSTASPSENNKRDDLISQWNIVQPVISDSEKRLLEQLKGKLKNKPSQEEDKKKEEKIVAPPPVVTFIKANEKKSSMEIRERVRSPVKRDDDRGDRDKDNDRGGSINRRRSRSRPSRRSKSRSLSRGRRIRRSRSRGGGMRRSRSRGRRSPSRSRYSPRGYGRRRRSRSPRRRSRSHGRSRRRISSSRSRSRSRSGSHRIEKPIIRQPEFRPRVPEVSSIKKSKTKTTEEKEERKKSSSKSSSSTSTAQSNKKLPFIGRMPVFKKQSQSSENSEKKDGEDGDPTVEVGPVLGPMSMMPDSFAHAGYEPSLMCEYDDLMPDPVQFVSLMGAPPPPPAQPPPQQYAEDEKDILPPGIDETESEFVPKPISDAPIPRKGPLPKDFEEALNIIFPGEKKPDDSGAVKSTGETQIITDEPVMQQSDLIKEGIHMMTVEETSLVGMDEASQMSMNEPLQFNKPSSSVATPSANNSGENSIDKSPPAMDPVEEAVAACVSAIPPPPPPPVVHEEIKEIPAPIVEKIEEVLPETKQEVTPPTKELDINDFEPKLDAIDQPPSPTESEKNRRQEELDDLAMLGIDADDMAAQCI